MPQRSSNYGHDADLKTPSERPTNRPHPWFVPGEGWIYLSDSMLAERQATAAARFRASAEAFWAGRATSKRPTRWPAKHAPLLAKVREMAGRGWTWSFNNRNETVAGVASGALFLRSPSGEEFDYPSLDAAAEALVGQAGSAAKKTGKVELVKFLRAVHTHLPEEHRTEAARLLEAA